jgi:CRP-like cAMP-binding protein
VRYAFGDCILDSDARQVYRGGCAVHLGPKAYELLRVLLAARPRVLSKIELFGQVWPETAVSESSLSTVVAELRSDRFIEALTDEPNLFVAVCQNLSAQLRLANDRLVVRNSNSATVRTARMLVELASLMMRHGGSSSSYDVPITQSDLADWIGATRESTARALAGFRRAGLVETCRGRIVVLDVLGLNEFVSAV